MKSIVNVMFLCVFTSLALGQDIDLDSDLIAYWGFNETEGMIATDGSGNGNDLFLIGEPEWIDGNMGGAVYLYQSPDDSILTYAMQYDSLLSDNFPSVSSGDTAITALTIACWLNFDYEFVPGTLLDRMSMVTKEQIENRGFTFELKGNANLAAQIYKDSTNATKPVSDATSLDIDTWHHVAMTYEFIDDGYSMCILYVDGEEDFYTENMVGPLTNNAAPIIVGAYIYDPNPGGYKRFFYGSLDEVYIYRRVLSHQEIKALGTHTGPETAVFDQAIEKKLSTFTMVKNYPNPFNPITTIDYTLTKGGKVQIAVYNLLGKNVALLLDEKQIPGQYRITFDAVGLVSGIYFCRLSVDDFVETHKITLLR